MSFYSGSRNSFCPGPITGNPLNGLCEKACIHTKKVFDACLRQMQETDVQVTVTNFVPAAPVQPLTFWWLTDLKINLALLVLVEQLLFLWKLDTPMQTELRVWQQVKLLLTQMLCYMFLNQVLFLSRLKHLQVV